MVPPFSYVITQSQMYDEKKEDKTMECKTATVVAVHRERYELLTEEKTLYGKLKTAAFYNADRVVDFPTVGDQVEI